jgi:hypothetical protein
MTTPTCLPEADEDEDEASGGAPMEEPAAAAAAEGAVWGGVGGPGKVPSLPSLSIGWDKHERLQAVGTMQPKAASPCRTRAEGSCTPKSTTHVHAVSESVATCSLALPGGIGPSHNVDQRLVLNGQHAVRALHLRG